MSNQCLLCSTPLTDAVSLSFGYGPKCLKKIEGSVPKHLIELYNKEYGKNSLLVNETIFSQVIELFLEGKIKEEVLKQLLTRVLNLISMSMGIPFPPEIIDLILYLISNQEKLKSSLSNESLISVELIISRAELASKNCLEENPSMVRVFPSLISLKEEIKKASPEKLVIIKNKLSYLTAVSPYVIFTKDQTIKTINKENQLLKAEIEAMKERVNTRVVSLETNINELKELNEKTHKENMSLNKEKELLENTVTKIKEEFSLVKADSNVLREENHSLKSNIKELESMNQKELSNNIHHLEDYRTNQNEPQYNQLPPSPSLLIIQGDKTLTDEIKKYSLEYAKKVKQPLSIEICSVTEKSSLSSDGVLKSWEFSVILEKIKKIRNFFNKKDVA